MGGLHMRLTTLVVFASGCNAVFGIVPTELPPPDALPRSCPASGAPEFSGTFHQVTMTLQCSELSLSFDANLAMAICEVGQSPVYVGPIDGELVHVPLATISGTVRLLTPRLAPEGNVAYVENGINVGDASRYIEYDATDPTTWRLVGDSGIPVNTLIGSVTRAPNRHVLATDPVNGALHELVQSGTTWTEVGTTSNLIEPGITVPANLTADGLHVIFHVGQGKTYATYYAARESIDAPFSPALRVSGVPDVVVSPFMTDDCTRVYFAGLGRVFYVEQI